MKRFAPVAAILGLIILCLYQALVAKEHSVSHPLDSHFSETYTDDLIGLMARRYIRVLTTLNKTNFFLFEGNRFGYEYGLLKEYEKFLNVNLKRRDLRVVLEFIPVARDQLIPSLVKGHGDIAAAGLTITKKRLKQGDFTDPYLSGIDEVLVTHKSTPKFQSLEQLSGQEVFVRQSSSYYESLSFLNQKLKRSRKRPVRIIKADENLETEDILELVDSGAIKITVSDSHIAAIWSGILKNLEIHEKIKLRSGSEIAWMIRKNNPELRASLNRFLKKHRKGTLLGNIYFNRYYEKNPWIKNPLQSKGKKRLHKYKALFQKYAKQYGFDWLLIAAMAYQESGLDNNKKNRSGAVGIMQVLPKTARDKNIGIKNVKDLENNIHAGVKYLAFLRDRYFSDQTIRPRDRVRFALASYNAGPAKIRKTRSLAKKMNLDSNRWFRNVELAALRLIGQETVRYVSNINKYYVIYKQDIERGEIREKAKKKIR
jgi:membrane-bound lytic murein transglycosylase MltF